MELPRGDRPPPFQIVRLGYLRLGVTALAASREFYVDRLGLNVSGEDGGTIWLRGLEEREHHSLVLVRSERPTVHAIGFKVAAEAELESVLAHYGGRGLPAEEVSLPRQGRTVRVRDPLGVPLEFYATQPRPERLLQRYGEYRGARVLRIDHVNLFVPDVEPVHAEYARLGFRTTEYTDTGGPSPRLWAAWLHRKGNVHDVALTSGHGPRLHHVGLWVPSVMDVIHACDLLATTGHRQALERGPGRHGISNAFFLYLRDPDGHRIELFTGDYLTVDPDLEPIRWQYDDPQRQTLWGHRAPESWFSEGSAFDDVVERPPVIDPDPAAAGHLS